MIASTWPNSVGIGEIGGLKNGLCFSSPFCKGIGVTPVKFHDLRATFITNLLAQGVPLVKVMSIVCHSKMSTTDEYLRLAGVDVKEGTIEKLGYSIPEVEKDNVVKLFN